ncbi:MAG: 3-dehydroquinate synthase [Dehalococcoidales bacterium]|nr:3-dehydroquinate synthase [Dehalococcoidales bacterium]
MKKINVRLGQNSYDIRIGSGALAQAGQLLKELGFSDKAVVITNPTVKKLYGNGLKQNITDSGFKTTMLEVPDGEEYKSLESAGKLYQQLMESGAERTTPLLALGGGVIGDLTGFVAATYMRGVPLVQLPTSLLAQVDSSIGGKTAVNHGKLKNEIGAFYQPRAVISDISALKTLPRSELTNGLSEVIKCAVIKDEQFFAYLEKSLDLIRTLDDNVLETIVSMSARIKAEVVENDEKDTGLRNILNFGHTVGHAVESVSDFRIAHGQAVAIGMVAAAKIALELGLMELKNVSRLQAFLERAGLMTKLPQLEPQLEVKQIMQAMRYDKKVQSGKIRFILPRSIGQVFITGDVNPGIVEKVLWEMK